MHPHPAFRFEGEPAMRAFVNEHAFAHLFSFTTEGPMVAHVPLAPVEGGAYRFHIARSNRLAPYLHEAVVLASVAGPDGYVSPDWYARPEDQVPTWNYAAVEIEATAHALDDDELLEQLDVLARVHESRLAPKAPWGRGKVDPARLRALLLAIQGFELRPTAWRGTKKYSQNKSEADRTGVLDALGDAPLAVAMRENMARATAR